MICPLHPVVLFLPITLLSAQHDYHRSDSYQLKRNPLYEAIDYTPAYVMSFAPYTTRYRPDPVTTASTANIIRKRPSIATFIRGNVTTVQSEQSSFPENQEHRVSSQSSNSQVSDNNCISRLSDIEGLSNEEAQAVSHLERAHSALVTFHQRIRSEMDQMREKDRLLSEELAKLTHEVNHNDQQLSLCQTSLHALETTVNEVYTREKDMSKSASSLEEENALLRQRLRKLIKVEIKRADHRNSSSGVRSRALIVHNNVSVAAFTSLRITMDEGFNLGIEDAVKKVSFPIVAGFSHLKILKHGNEFRLSLANQRGNQFFEHKKYDKFYAVVPNSMKTIPSSAILLDKPINWQEMNKKCGFWSCFSLKPGLIEHSPEVISRDKTRIGILSPIAAYFEHQDLTIVNGKEETSFTNPYLDRDRNSQYSIREDIIGSHKRFPFDLNLLEVADRSKLNQMLHNAFP